MVTDLLKFTLSLTIAGTTYPIPGGQVKSLSVDLQSHGFSAEVVFVLVDDTALQGPNSDRLYTAFVGDDLISVAMKVETPLVDEDPQKGATAFELHGLVSDRSLTEQSIEKSLSRSRVRLYRIRFLDPAQLLWKQHFP